MTSAPEPSTAIGPSRRRQRAAVRRRVDAPRQPADDDDAARGQIAGQPLGHGQRIRRTGAGSDNRHRRAPEDARSRRGSRCTGGGS